MKNLFLLLIFFTLSSISYAQQKVEVAHLNEDGSIYVTQEIRDHVPQTQTRASFTQLDGFPQGYPAHPAFKNTRNVSQADLNGNGKSEIIVCLGQSLIVFNSDGSILWSYILEGTSNYPPAIGDIDNDGNLDIVCQTYGIPRVGRVYAFDGEGNVLDGFPFSGENPANFFLNGITLADVDLNDTLDIIACERVSGTEGVIHILDYKAESINENWPDTIPGTPAVTPTVGDLDNDGLMEIITATTSALYVLEDDGSVKEGFPKNEPGTSFSYQSPLAADFDGDKLYEIIGNRHGDNPGPFVLSLDTSYYGNWPQYDSSWTYAPPTVVDSDGDGEYEIYYGRPFVSEDTVGACLLGFTEEGTTLDQFPRVDMEGTEGLISIADIDDDGDYEILTPSKIKVEGTGYIHAYHLESLEEVENFPIEVTGFTFLNGAYLGDVDNDGNMDLTALSYQQKFDGTVDTGFVNVFNLETPYDESKILFNGYKGSVSHDGMVAQLSTSIVENKIRFLDLEIHPNPAQNVLNIKNDFSMFNAEYYIFDMSGILVNQGLLRRNQIDISDLKQNSYILMIKNQDELRRTKFTVIK